MLRELQERIEECLARMKELPGKLNALSTEIIHTKEQMNGRSAISKLQDQVKEMKLAFIADARAEVFEDTGKFVFTNDKARENKAIELAKDDSLYQETSKEIDRLQKVQQEALIEYDRLSKDREDLGKEHTGLISTVDVLREMLSVAKFRENRKEDTRISLETKQFQSANLKAQIWVMETEIKEIDGSINKEQEASNAKE